MGKLKNSFVQENRFYNSSMSKSVQKSFSIDDYQDSEQLVRDLVKMNNLRQSDFSLLLQISDSLCGKNLSKIQSPIKTSPKFHMSKRSFQNDHK